MLTPSQREPPVIHLRNAVHCIATWRDILFHVWFTDGNVAHIDQSIETRRRIYQSRAE